MTHSTVVVKKELLVKEDKTIPLGSMGAIVSESYLKKSSIPKEFHDDILRDADLANSKGFLYVDFSEHRACLAVHPDDIF